MSFIPLPDPDPDTIKRRSRIAGDLAKLLPDAVFIEDEEGRRAYETDALAVCHRIPMLVILPSSTRETSALLSYCHRENIKLVARGAGTSLCGSVISGEDMITVGLSRMRRILELDYENRTARIECGVTNQGLGDAISEHGFFYAPDPSSKSACTIGGNIAMNSGGAHALKHGVTTNNILGVKMVLMNGDILELGGDHLDAAGYDMLGLLAGSEGQLGIVTEATVRILPKAEMARPILLGFANPKDAGNCITAIFASGMIPTAMEFMDRRAIHICENKTKCGYPLDVEAMLIVEVEGSQEETGLQLDHVREIAGRFNANPVRIAQNEQQAEEIWRGRKAVPGAFGSLSDYYCLDSVIPVSRLIDVLGWVDHIGRHHDFEVANIFHAGDGTLHPMILCRINDEDELARARECGAELLRLGVKAGGCLSGELGIGLEKRHLMHAQFSDPDLVQQTRIKTVFDPGWLLNPDKKFPPDAPGRGGIEAEIAELVTPVEGSE